MLGEEFRNNGLAGRAMQLARMTRAVRATPVVAQVLPASEPIAHAAARRQLSHRTVSLSPPSAVGSSVPVARMSISMMTGGFG